MVVSKGTRALDRKGLTTMEKMIAESKLSKKARKELNASRRVTWGFSPVSRTKDSRKVYNRKRIDKEVY